MSTDSVAYLVTCTTEEGDEVQIEVWCRPEEAFDTMDEWVDLSLIPAIDQHPSKYLADHIEDWERS